MDINRLKRPPRRLLAELMRIESGEVLPDNFHVVNHNLRIYRSSQPSRAEFLELEKFGFKSVLNLRSHHSDLPLIAGLKLAELRLPLHIISESDMTLALEILRNAPKPVVIHCWHGSDRTGAVAAGCRIVFENWSLERALEEFNQPAYGAHRHIYRMLPELLKSFDWDKIRQDIAPVPETPCDAPAAESDRPIPDSNVEI